MRFLLLPLLLLTLLAAPVTAAWVDERSFGIFEFHAEFPLRDIEPLVVELGELQKDIESTLDLKCSDRRIEVYLFSNRWSYQQYTRKNVPDGAGRQALYVAGNDAGRVYAYRHRDLDTDLRHETTHALLHNALPYVPLWLDEGLAEYFEVPAGLRAEKQVRMRVLGGIVNRRIAPLSQLEAIRKLPDFTANDYRDARCWIHFLLHGPPEAHAALEEFLATIPTGREPTPVSVGLQRRLPDLDARFQQHFR
ncbi:MAG TPA: hypothetical protein VFG20_01890 [Planctomycetaceae bacterium]|nr:hypothetical protein [Planctomycetaceae bacterium]